MLSRLPFLIPFIAITEIYLIIKVGGAIGFWPTVGIVLCTGMTGVWLLRQQSFQLLSQLNQKINQGQLPAAEMVEGVALMIGGVMLITPGFLTDISGFCLLLPWTRKPLVQKVSAMFANQLQTRSATSFYYTSGASPFNQAQENPFQQEKTPDSGVQKNESRTYEGEFSEVEDANDGEVKKK